MTWILDPADPVVAAWLRGEPEPTPAQRCGHRRRRMSEEERQRRCETERQRRRRHAKAIAEGRVPGQAGTPGHRRRA